MAKSEILFLSDLHLSFEKGELVNYFLKFLAERAPQATQVYILGDLFDAWVGDDDFTGPSKRIRQALQTLTQQGTQVFFQNGNRDFLLGEAFAQNTGIHLLDDVHVIHLFGKTALLTHGDLLCTDDTAYQAFRKKSRDPVWRQNVLSKPLWLRLLAARWYRLRSYWHKRGKSLDIMDVNQQTVVDYMSAQQAELLIHGHTHRQAVHEFEIDDKLVKRIVLPDWNKQNAQILCFDKQGFRFEFVI